MAEAETPITVSLPDPALREAFWAMLDDYAEHDPAEGDFFYPARPDFAAYVQSLQDEEQGLNLRPNWVPCSHRWLLNAAGDLIGLVRVRHNILPPFLAEEGGHIGYDVPPAFRGHGYAVHCLRAGLAVARTLGLTRVLLCADADNPASWKTIEKCGGVLEVERYSAYFKTRVRRYWIDLQP
jgi:predicted acetyltransferase